MNNQSRSASSIKNDHAQAEALLGFSWSLPDAFFKNIFSQSTEDCEELRRAVRHSREGGNRSITDVSPLSSCAPSASCSSSASATLKTCSKSDVPNKERALWRVKKIFQKLFLM